MTRVNHLETKNELLGLQKIISCIDPNVYNQVKFLSNRGNSNNINTLDLIKYTNGRPYVDLKLTEANDENKVPLKSGLNWGQRSGRNQNQAYINVPTHIRNTYPDFFPNQKEKFVLVTDDGYHFICVMSQDNAKAITTSRDTSELGKYFRKRLGVELGNLITINDLDSYGRDYVRIYKLNDETYFLEFS
ncbi:hypothetical protein JCM9140_4455 [Halalkalibacter wakoensis JCM 9140]|uniref:Restriction endonuclease type II NgoFVII C-terminal B3-like DNA-binding domain-containing protein n=1 Tax=Halalkalibacter wakoensis JCM 9140 TaxID=1236970 RepID=W4Q8C6_9BACI|nr:hypothetical protein JCM9140_4455 [Halalkalibacter wakoensis JCM 9140]